MQIKIDCLPLAKSSSSQFYPILLGLVRLNSISRPFVIGIYHGYAKPKDPNEFLSDFVNEMDDITNNGLLYYDECNVERTTQLHISVIICDAPAKAFILQTKYHTAFYSCTKCTQRGEWAGRVIFVLRDAPLRDDFSFRNQSQEEYHSSVSIFCDLKLI